MQTCLKATQSKHIRLVDALEAERRRVGQRRVDVARRSAGARKGPICRPDNLWICGEHRVRYGVATVLTDIETRPAASSLECLDSGRVGSWTDTQKLPNISFDSNY